MLEFVINFFNEKAIVPRENFEKWALNQQLNCKKHSL